LQTNFEDEDVVELSILEEAPLVKIVSKPKEASTSRFSPGTMKKDERITLVMSALFCYDEDENDEDEAEAKALKGTTATMTVVAKDSALPHSGNNTKHYRAIYGIPSSNTFTHQSS
jgi:hypothetical protein